MNKLYKDATGNIHAISPIQTPKKEWVPMTETEVEAHLNPQPTPEQIYEQWKSERQQSVDSIEVEYNGVIYQGDELSQTRMARSITALPDDATTVPWTAKDNTVHGLTRADLRAILLDAGTQQALIWNEGRPQVAS